MSKRPRVRIVGEKRAQTLRNLNKRVSNKKSRIRVEKGLEVQGVELKRPEDFKSVKDFNAYVRQQKAFLDRDADFVVKNKRDVSLRYSDVREVEKDMRTVNKRRAKEWDKIKDLEFKDRGKKIGELKEMRLIQQNRYTAFQPVTFDVHKMNSQKDLEEKRQQMKWRKYDKTQSRNLQMQENYLKSIRSNFNLTGWDHFPVFNPDVIELYEHINKMTNREFMKYYWRNNLTEISFVYSFLDEQKKISEMRQAFGLEA